MPNDETGLKVLRLLVRPKFCAEVLLSTK